MICSFAVDLGFDLFICCRFEFCLLLLGFYFLVRFWFAHWLSILIFRFRFSIHLGINLLILGFDCFAGFGIQFWLWNSVWHLHLPIPVFNLALVWFGFAFFFFILHWFGLDSLSFLFFSIYHWFEFQLTGLGLNLLLIWFWVSTCWSYFRFGLFDYPDATTKNRDLVWLGGVLNAIYR